MKIKEVKKVYSHKNCMDGTASALICARAFAFAGLSPDIEFIQYRSDEHKNLVAAPNQMFVDITPPLDRWEEWKEVSPIVLDHHVTAESAVKGLKGKFGDENYSGSTLAFEYVMVPLMSQAPSEELDAWNEFARLCTIRDTWKTDHVDWDKSQELSQALYYYNPYELIEDARKGKFDFEFLMKFGKLAYGKIDYKAGRVAEGGPFLERRLDNGDTIHIAFINLTEKLISEVAEKIRQKDSADITIGYAYSSNNQLICSLRSNKFDCSKIAEKFEGGGHKGAAGFSIGNGNPEDVLNIQPMKLVEMVVSSINSLS